ncbi:MAG TPA: DUF5995 family protein [Candidatus Binatia bacterium]|nr:DUF5995 family protein [Candidatus Binatia bacterium]
MNLSAVDQELLQIVNGAGPITIADVVAKMEAINDALPSGDGLKWFNLLYLNVTQQVDEHPPPGGWEDTLWLTRLDVVFAQLYFAAIADWLRNSASAPDSWKALFESRLTSGIDRIQFALAGMNAHINHDLALALLQTNTEMNLTPLKQSPEHDDFENVNGLLEAVLPQALRFLATGVVGEAVQDTGEIGRFLAIWDVRAARDLAWDVSDSLRPLSGIERNVALAAQDQLTGVLGRSLLL